jgi:hypothetical protein
MPLLRSNLEAIRGIVVRAENRCRHFRPLDEVFVEMLITVTEDR